MGGGGVSFGLLIIAFEPLNFAPPPLLLCLVNEHFGQWERMSFNGLCHTCSKDLHVSICCECVVAAIMDQYYTLTGYTGWRSRHHVLLLLGRGPHSAPFPRSINSRVPLARSYHMH